MLVLFCYSFQCALAFVVIAPSAPTLATALTARVMRVGLRSIACATMAIAAGSFCGVDACVSVCVL